MYPVSFSLSLPLLLSLSVSLNTHTHTHTATQSSLIDTGGNWSLFIVPLISAFLSPCCHNDWSHNSLGKTCTLVELYNKYLSKDIHGFVFPGMCRLPVQYVKRLTTYRKSTWVTKHKGKVVHTKTAFKKKIASTAPTEGHSHCLFSENVLRRDSGLQVKTSLGIKYGFPRVVNLSNRVFPSSNLWISQWQTLIL